MHTLPPTGLEEAQSMAWVKLLCSWLSCVDQVSKSQGPQCRWTIADVGAKACLEKESCSPSAWPSFANEDNCRANQSGRETSLTARPQIRLVIVDWATSTLTSQESPPVAFSATSSISKRLDACIVLVVTTNTFTGTCASTRLLRLALPSLPGSKSRFDVHESLIAILLNHDSQSFLRREFSSSSLQELPRSYGPYQACRCVSLQQCSTETAEPKFI